MSKHITQEMWQEAGDFTKVAEPGDTVEESIAMHFLNCVPPVRQKHGYFQCGEPAFDARYKDTKVYAPTFSTFAERNGVWTYLGDCFAGESEPQKNPYIH